MFVCGAVVEVCQKYFLLKKYMHKYIIYAKMAAAQYLSDVLQTSNCQLSEAI